MIATTITVTASAAATPNHGSGEARLGCPFTANTFTPDHDTIDFGRWSGPPNHAAASMRISPMIAAISTSTTSPKTKTTIIRRIVWRRRR